MKKALLLVLVSQLFIVISYTQNLRTFSENGKFGYKQGSMVVIQPAYEYAADFSEGKAAVKLNGKWGFIDAAGKMVVQPKYKKVDRFSDGFVRFYEGQKFGLINSRGEQVVEAICDEVDFSENGPVLKSNGKKAWVSSATGKMATQFIYDKINTDDYFIECRRGDQYDYYSRQGKMVAENCKESQTFLTPFTGTVLDVNFEDKAYLIDTNGVKISDDFRYISMEEINFYRIPKEDRSDYRVLLCYYNEEPSKLKIVRSDGHIFDGVYDEFFFADMKVFARKGNDPYTLNSEGEMVKTDYFAVQQIYDHLILTTANGNQLLAQSVLTDKYFEYFVADTLILDTFASIRPLYIQPTSYYANQYYYDYTYDASIDSYLELNPYRIVEVEGLNENKGKYALYNLITKSFITPYDNTKNELVPEQVEDDIYRFRNERGVLSANVRGKMLPYKYASIQKYSEKTYIFTDTLGHSSSFSTLSGNWTTIPDNLRILNSYNYGKGEPVTYFDEQSGESYSVDPPQKVYRQFVVLMEDADNSYVGFIDHLGTIVSPQFDSITEDMNFIDQGAPEPIILTWKNGKCGAYNLDYGVITEPVFDSVLKFNYDQYTRISRAAVPSQHFYLSSKGKKFPGTTFEPEFFTRDGKMGARDYIYFNDQETLQIIIPPVYKTLKVNPEAVFQVEAQNQVKKLGVIHLETGDTLVPFEFTKLESKYGTDYYDGIQGAYYKTYNKKLVGMYDLVSLRSIPAVYDDVHEGYADLLDATLFYVHKEGKVGLYSHDLVKLLDCEYDGITVQNVNDYLLVFALKGNKVYVFNYRFNSLNNQNLQLNEFDFVVGGLGYRKAAEGYTVFDIASLEYRGSTKTIPLLKEDNSDYLITEENGTLKLTDNQTGKTAINGLRLVEFVDGEYVVVFENGKTFYQSAYNKKNRFDASKW